MYREEKVSRGRGAVKATGGYIYSSIGITFQRCLENIFFPFLKSISYIEIEIFLAHFL